MKGVFSFLAAGTLLCLLTNTALADDTATNSEAARQDHSLLSIWDKPAFSPAPYIGEVPGLDSRRAKGQRLFPSEAQPAERWPVARSEGQLAGEFRGRAASSGLTRLPHAAATMAAAPDQSGG
jgi:hypothetical protein